MSDLSTHHSRGLDEQAKCCSAGPRRAAPREVGRRRRRRCQHAEALAKVPPASSVVSVSRPVYCPSTKPPNTRWALPNDDIEPSLRPGGTAEREGVH
ncbi:unnamed protein product [Lota lota]